MENLTASPTKNMDQLLKELNISFISEKSGTIEYSLNSNGLKILLCRNNTAPVATFMLLYRIGSINEGVGYTGSTHFLEHMMFKGTEKNNPENGQGFDDQLKPIGAMYNATTWFDRTNYFEAVPSEHLELCIRLEADRMRGLLIRQEDRDAEMTVVRNEFERGENDPHDVLLDAMYAHAFSAHPYHHPTIGWRSDIEGVPLERLKEFYDTYYWPSNATAIVVGDFEQEDALKLIHKYFNNIAKPKHVIPTVYTVEPPQEGERRFELRRAGELCQVMLAYHIPEAQHKDTHAIAALASILGSSDRRSTRLYKRLIDTGLAVDCFTWHNEQRDPGLIFLGATVNPGVHPKDVEDAIIDEIAKLAAEPPTSDELNRAKSANRKGTVLAAADPMVFVSQLGEAEAVANWRWLMDYDENFDAVSLADVQRVAGTYFARENRTVGWFIPKGLDEALSKIKPGKKVKATNGKESGSISFATTPAIATLKKPEKAERPSFAKNVQRTVLDNGMTVLVLPNPGTGSIAVTAKLRAGFCFADHKLSLTPSVVTDMMVRGTSKYTKTQIGEILEEMGSSLAIKPDNFAVNLASKMVTGDLPTFLELLSDVIQKPLMADVELKKCKTELTSYLQEQITDTSARARNQFLQSLYPADSVYYAKTFEEQMAEVEAITRQDIRDFHKQYFSPVGMVLTIVGDIEPDTALSLVRTHFEKWKGKQAPVIVVPPVAAPTRAQRVEVPIPDKKNVDIIIGYPVDLKRTAPEFYPAMLGNNALGKDTLSSRLGLVVREREGLTYGIHSGFEDVSFGYAPWIISLSVNPVNIDKALSLVNDVVAEYRTSGIRDKEHADEAGRAAGSFVVGLRTSMGMASSITSYEYLGLPLELLDNFSRDVKAVTKDQINSAIDKYLTLDKAITVIAGT